MRPVVQRERTGCGIAAAAAIAGLSYREAKRVANGMGIHASDERLWSRTDHVRRLLRRLGFSAARGERRFSSWRRLPDLALLAIKWHRRGRHAFWHWVVFARPHVLDSRKGLRSNRRTDFGRIKPKWFIPVSAR